MALSEVGGQNGRKGWATLATVRIKNKNIFAERDANCHSFLVVIEHPPFEDELGDVLEKAMRQTGLSEAVLAERAQVSAGKIAEAIDYRYDLNTDEVRRLALALGLNEIGLVALAQGKYPLPEIGGLPFCLYPLRMPHGIGVANAYIVADCISSVGILFDTGPDYLLLRRVWPKNIRTIASIFITHTETEHVGALRDLTHAFGDVPVYCPEGAALPRAKVMNEGDELLFGDLKVKALKTPGHAEAHNCYAVSRTRLSTAPSLLISGDLLFAGSTGGAYYCKSRLANNLQRLFTTLPEATVVAPGHGPLTTIKNERCFNPFVN
jgi:glyoxylase-like metal-dependent hydrolase (beta-lactamase superfamily II)